MSALGKFVSHQLQMSDEEKAQIFSKFKEDVFFKEVYNDYLCTFFSMIQFLADNGILKQIYTKTGNEYNTMINNLKNPMFPKDRVGQLLADMISKYPFAQAEYELLINVYGENDETREIINYFNFQWINGGLNKLCQDKKNWKILQLAYYFRGYATKFLIVI